MSDDIPTAPAVWKCCRLEDPSPTVLERHADRTRNSTIRSSDMLPPSTSPMYCRYYMISGTVSQSVVLIAPSLGHAVACDP